MTTGDRSFFGMSSIIVFISTFSDTPFCKIFPFSPAVFPLNEVFEVFDTGVDFFVGDATVVGFAVKDARFIVVVLELVDKREVVLEAGVLVRPMEICLLAVSFTCLSIAGNLLSDMRGFDAVPLDGAVFGLLLAVALMVVVVLLAFTVVLNLLAEEDLTFGTVVVPVDARVEDVLTSVVLVAKGDADGLLEDLVAVAGLLKDLTSPFAVGFLSVTVTDFEVVVAIGFGLEVVLTLVLLVDFVAVVDVVVFEADFATDGLLVVVEEIVDFFGASRSFGREGVVVDGFFIAAVDVRVVEDTVFEGDVGVDFVGVAFEVVVFVGFVASVFAFVLLCAATAPAVTAPAAPAATAAVAVAIAAVSMTLFSGTSVTFSISGSLTSISFISGSLSNSLISGF